MGKRERTTSITRLRSISDAAREGFISTAEKEKLKALVLCNDKRADEGEWGGVCVCVRACVCVGGKRSNVASRKALRIARRELAE